MPLRYQIFRYSTHTGSNPVLTTKNKRMKKQFVKDLPIYLNGFAVGMLFFRSGVSSTNVVAYALAMITFFWYGKINKQSGGGMVDAMDGYSTMCKKAYSVCGPYNNSTTTGSNPVLTTK